MVIGIEYVPLGNTDLLASRIGLGCELLGGTDWGQVDEDAAIDAVRRAVDLGINVFDTADVYGLGRSEEVLSRALGAHRHDMVIITKCGVRWARTGEDTRARTFRDSSPTYIMQAVEASLKRLRMETLPVYLLHWPDPNTAIEDSVEALLKCQAQGKIRHFGFSNFDVHLLERAASLTDKAVLEVPYSLIERNSEPTISFAAHSAWGVATYGVLAQGLLSGKYDGSVKFDPSDRRHRLPHFSEAEWPRNKRILERMSTLAREKGSTMAQLAIVWVLANTGVSVALAGARTPTQVDANVAALTHHLSDEELDMLNHLAIA